MNDSTRDQGQFWQLLDEKKKWDGPLKPLTVELGRPCWKTVLAGADILRREQCAGLRTARCGFNKQLEPAATAASRAGTISADIDAGQHLRGPESAIPV